MKKLPLLFVFLLGFCNSSSLQAQSKLVNMIEILHELSDLADEFNLTSDQKTQVKSVLINYLPNIAIKATAMINNRKNLLESNIVKSSNQDKNEFMIEIARLQGELLTGIIISKEYMKNDIRNILTDEQQDFVNDLLTAIIQHRINHS